MTTATEGMSPELQALLDAERPLPAPPVGLDAQIYARMEPALGAALVSGAAGRSLWAKWLSGKAGLAVVAFAAGGGVGTAVTARVLTRPPLPAPAPVAAPVPMVTAPAPVDAPPAPTLPATPARPAPTARREGELSIERSLLEGARTAVLRANFDGALGAVEAHARRFPQGALVEERESLRIQALCGLGRLADCRRAAEGFRRAYPRSIFLPLVDAAAAP